MDKFGCKPFLMLNLFGQLIGDIGIMINFAFIEQLPLEFFFIETLYGLFGGAPVWYLSKYCHKVPVKCYLKVIFISGMYAYGALVSKPESRATRLALFDGTESLFVVIGTILSPIIKNNFGRYTNYGLKVGCTFLALLYIIFLVKEPPKSDEDKDKKQEKLTIITPLLSFVDLIKTVFKRLQKISYQMFSSIIFECQQPTTF